MSKEEEEKKKTKKKIYAGLAICLAVFLIFAIGFETGSKKGYGEGETAGKNAASPVAFDEGYDACLTPILDAAYSAEGDNLVSLRTDKWKNPAKKQIVVLQCDVVQEIGPANE
jgi:amino acid permease